MMVRTPKTETIVLAAGVTVPMPIAGSMLTILSCTVAEFEAAFDSDGFSTFYPGVEYQAPEPFYRIRFRDSLGGGCTIVAVFSDAPVIDSRGAQILLPGTTPVLIPRTVVAAVGAPPATLVLAANPKRKWFMIEMGLGNPNYVYLGFANTVSPVDSFFEGMAGATSRESLTSEIWAVSDGGVETVKGYEFT